MEEKAEYQKPVITGMDAIIAELKLLADRHHGVDEREKVCACLHERLIP